MDDNHIRDRFDEEFDRRRENDLITRDEFKSEVGRVESVLGTQIGAVERTLNSKLSNLRAWGIAALVGGQAAAGVLAALVPRQAAHTAMAILHYL